MDQLGELERSAAALRAAAEVYVVNPDTPEHARRVKQQSGLTLPLLLDPGYTVAKQFDLPGAGRPMNGLVGFVVIDPSGTIRVQRVDIDFGRHAAQILEMVRIVGKESRR
ncbi:MAG: redoxin domain-containing protein [Armatimonadota bacterium]|nr:redoxin domain-containing protein [Armatimonadota bacterium]MDR7519093.1 redoxin domain-containing protein [Armatimonadota bacterium]MDR7548978.1 redoxin domain-containing protein [Armatimonadota bacterium]